jgi:hypothetical protein
MSSSSRFKLDPFASDDCRSASGHDIQPLIGTAMAVIRTAFMATSGQRHLSGLRPPIADGNLKLLGKSQLLVFHPGLAKSGCTY